MQTRVRPLLCAQFFTELFLELHLNTPQSNEEKLIICHRSGRSARPHRL